MKCEEAQKFEIPNDEPNSLLAGKHFNAGEKKCCVSEVGNGVPCNDGTDSWMGLPYDTLEDIGAGLFMLLVCCGCVVKLYVLWQIGKSTH